MMRRLYLLFTFVACCSISVAWGQEKSPAPADETSLPKVFIIGDSISLGYTGPVTQLLAGKAVVTRPDTNCQHTAFGLRNVQKWLGDTKFDVIHFNWGIWDTHFLGNGTNGLIDTKIEINPETMHIRHTPEEYAENLQRLVKILKGSGKKLIFATTTPIWKEGSVRFVNIANYNAAAAKVMEEEGVAIDDLYTLVLPQRAKWQGEDLVHFNATGNQHLGKQVRDSILEALAVPAMP